MRIPLIGPAYASQSPIADSEQLMNWYLETVESPNAPDRYVAYPSPGVTLWKTLPNTPIRGLFTQNGRFWAVAGAGLYEVAEDKTVTAIGAMNVDANPCTFASSGDVSNQLVVSSGNHVYWWPMGGGALTDVLTGGVFVIFLNNRFVALDVATNTIHVSNFNDAAAFPGGNDQQRSISGDKWKSMLADGQYMWLFGGQKSDVYQFAGSGNTLFVPVQGVSINEGIGAPFSACIINNAPEWLNANEHGRAMILRAENFSPVRRSTHAVEFAMQNYDLVQDAVAFPYQEDGHSFYVANFPTARASWVDDAAREMNDSWHMRGYWDSAAMTYQAFRPQFHAFCFGKHLVGDRETGNIYEMSNSIYTDVDGTGIRRLRRTAPMRAELRRIFYGQVILNIETGVGLPSGQGSNPQIMARWSDDGGRTYGNEHWQTIGKIGAFRTRVNWPNTGAARQRVYEFVGSDPVPYRLIGGYVDANVGVD